MPSRADNATSVALAAPDAARSQVAAPDTPYVGQDAPGAGQDTPYVGQDARDASQDVPYVAQDAGQDVPYVGQDASGAEQEARQDARAASQDVLCAALLRELGGAGNIVRLNHCTTRLRIRVAVGTKVDVAALKSHHEVFNVIVQGSEFQLVINGAVDELCQALQQVLGNTESPVKRQALERWEFRPSDMASRFGTITSMMSAAILPLIGFLTASALLSTMTGVLVYTGLLEPSDRLYTFFNSIFNLLINFLPVLVGYNCARWLKSSPLVSMVLGLCLVPNFYYELSAMMPGYDRFTLPLLTKLQSLINSRFDPTVYQVSVLPILVATVLNARLEHWSARVIPSSVQSLVMPLICLCVCVPILILVIAPLCTVIGYCISEGFLSFYEFSPSLMGLIAGGVWEFLVVVGLHWLISPFMLNNLSILGYDMMMAIVMVPTAATAGTMVGNYLYLRHHKLKGTELTNARNASLLAVIFGITEPVLYTYLVARTKLFLLVGAVAALGGLVIGQLGVHLYSLSLSSTFAVVAAYRPGVNESLWPLLGFVVTILSGFSVAMILSFLWRKREAQQAAAQADVGAVGAVCAGSFVPLPGVNDPIFSALMLGDGYAIKPGEDVIYAPCSGTVSEDIVFAHAVGIKGPYGAEILVHVGINTVRLEGQHFKLLVPPGSTIKAGEPLLSFDRAAIEAAGYDPTVIVICTLPDGVRLTHCHIAAGTEVKVGQELVTLSTGVPVAA